LYLIWKRAHVGGSPPTDLIVDKVFVNRIDESGKNERGKEDEVSNERRGKEIICHIRGKGQCAIISDTVQYTAYSIIHQRLLDFVQSSQTSIHVLP